MDSGAFRDWLTPGRRAFFTGTLLLASTGFLCRVLGFFYRIFMSRAIGAEGLGLYHLVHPVFNICFALCAGSVQTALSQYIAAHRERGKAVFFMGLSISLSFSLVLAWLIWSFREPMARFLLLEPRCAPLLPGIAVSVPFAALHACINGYYYGEQKTRVPAFSQVMEQVVRIGLVFAIASLCVQNGKELTASLAVLGHLIGEMTSAAFTFLCCLLCPPGGRVVRRQKKSAEHETLQREGVAYTQRQSQQSSMRSQRMPQKNVTPGQQKPQQNVARSQHQPWQNAKPGQQKPQQNAALSQRLPHRNTQQAASGDLAALGALALPLMGNRLVLNLLGSAEAVWIPSKLSAFGLTDSQSLSVYGALTSMALPFVLFPSAITNSMAVLLLPSAARAQAGGEHGRISSMISFSVWSSLSMGILCIGLFTRFGRMLGEEIFQKPEAGSYITILCWLCPFLYLSTTLGSIQNGLGKTSVTFLQNTAALCVRLAFVILAIPIAGIRGYLWGMLLSELLLALMSFYSVSRLIPVSLNPVPTLVIPLLCLITALGTDLAVITFLPLFHTLSPLAGGVLRMLLMCLCYVGLLLLLCPQEAALKNAGK